MLVGPRTFIFTVPSGSSVIIIPDMPNDSQPLDSVDQAILEALSRDARIPNNKLAESVGVAPSTFGTWAQGYRKRW